MVEVVFDPLRFFAPLLFFSAIPLSLPGVGPDYPMSKVATTTAWSERRTRGTSPALTSRLSAGSWRGAALTEGSMKARRGPRPRGHAGGAFSSQNTS